MAEELTSDVVQEERATFDNNCNLTKSDITIDEDPDVSLRGILDTAFTSTVDSQDNGVFESSKLKSSYTFSLSNCRLNRHFFVLQFLQLKWPMLLCSRKVI